MDESHTNELLAEVKDHQLRTGRRLLDRDRGAQSQYRHGGIASVPKESADCRAHGQDQIFDVMSRSNSGYELLGTDLIRFIASDVDPATAGLTFKRVVRSA